MTERREERDDEPPPPDQQPADGPGDEKTGEPGIADPGRRDSEIETDDISDDPEPRDDRPKAGVEFTSPERSAEGDPARETASPKNENQPGPKESDRAEETVTGGDRDSPLETSHAESSEEETEPESIEPEQGKDKWGEAPSSDPWSEAENDLNEPDGEDDPASDVQEESEPRGEPRAPTEVNKDGGRGPNGEKSPKERDHTAASSESGSTDNSKTQGQPDADSRGTPDDAIHESDEPSDDDPLKKYEKAVKTTHKRVFRGDTRNPDDIFVNGTGFRARGTSSDLKGYAELNEASRFIGTSRTEDAAKPFTVDTQGSNRKLHGWIYDIESPAPAINVNKALGLRYRLLLWGQAEKELAFIDHIPREHIRRAREVKGLSYTGTVVENPHFQGRRDAH